MYKGIEGYRYAGIYTFSDTICYWNGYGNEIIKLSKKGNASKIVRFDLQGRGVPRRILNPTWKLRSISS